MERVQVDITSWSKTKKKKEINLLKFDMMALTKIDKQP